MKIGRNVVLVMIAIVVMLLATAGFVSADGIVKQEYWVSDGFSCLNHAGSTWHAQTFVANSTYKVTGIELQYINYGATGNASVSIRSTDNGTPTGADLATSNPVNLDNLPDWPPTTVYFDFNSPYLELTSGVEYAIVARVPDADGIFCIGYYNPGGFSSGEMFQSFNSGGGWMWPDNLDTFDLLFRIYGEEEVVSPGSLQVTKVIDWSGTTPDENKTFEICVSGPTYPDSPSCVALGDGQSATWLELEPGEYTITETDPGADWQVSGSGQVVVVASGQAATTSITNTFVPPPEPGSLQVTKVIDWSGAAPDENKTFEICVSGPTYPNDPSCVALGDGQSATWLELEPGEYTITETDPGADWQVSGSGQVVVVASGQAATTSITNTFIPPVEPPVEVGGHIYSINKTNYLIPFIAGVVFITTWVILLTWRRKTHS